MFNSDKGLLVSYIVSLFMVEFKEKGGELKAIDNESHLGENMTLQFIDEDTSVFINTTTGKAEEVETEEIPDEFLEQELELQRERAENTGIEDIKSKVKSIEKILNS